MNNGIHKAFRFCEEIAKSHYENFPVGWFIPKRQRPYLFAVYAFARTADDFSDEAAYKGERIARHLVGEHLAACVNLLAPCDSVYRWRGEIQRDQEHPLLIKTAQDRYAEASLLRARNAIREGAFAREIVPVQTRSKKESATVDQDEQPLRADASKISRLKPAFRPDGTVTAANSSSISDGAAALVLMKAATAEQRGIRPLACLRAHATHSQEPGRFTTAPIGAIAKVLQKAGWRAEDADLYEINEAFAVVVMAAMRDLRLPHEKVNVHGGACALGHPIGASGARIVVTLLSALERRGLKRGIAALCIGGGEATAVAVERI